MDIALWHKFTQHSDLKQELLGTGDAELIEVSYYRLLELTPSFVIGLLLCRILIRTRSGASEWTVEGVTSSAKLWRDYVISFADRYSIILFHGIR